jgi:hypothetical protein
MHEPVGKFATTLAQGPFGIPGPCGERATALATCGGGKGSVGEGASRFSIDSIARQAHLLQRAVRWRRRANLMMLMGLRLRFGELGRATNAALHDNCAAQALVHQPSGPFLDFASIRRIARAHLHRDDAVPESP